PVVVLEQVRGAYGHRGGEPFSFLILYEPVKDQGAPRRVPLDEGHRAVDRVRGRLRVGEGTLQVRRQLPGPVRCDRVRGAGGQARVGLAAYQTPPGPPAPRGAGRGQGNEAGQVQGPGGVLDGGPVAEHAAEPDPVGRV